MSVMYNRAFGYDSDDYPQLEEYRQNLTQKSVEHFKHKAQWTPDLMALKNAGTLHPVFIVGPTQVGKVHAYMTNQAMYFGKVRTISVRDWLCLRNTRGDVVLTIRHSKENVGLIPYGNMAYKGLEGELFGCTIDQIMGLDRYHCENNGFYRIKQSVYLRQRRGTIVSNHTVDAHMYVASVPVWSSRVESHEFYSCNTLIDKGDQYYYY